MVLRSVVFILAAANVFQAYLNEVSSISMRLMFVLIAGCDFTFGSLGFYASKYKDINLLRYHGSYRIVAMLVFYPFICGYLLFDEKISQHLNLFLLSFFILLLVLAEVLCTIQVYRLILYEMKLQSAMQPAQSDNTNREKDPFVGGIGAALNLPHWAYDDPDQVYVLFGTVPLQLAVSAFCGATIIICTVGVLAGIVFPNAGLSFGAYSGAVTETRYMLMVLDAMGLYFGFLGLQALQMRSAYYLGQFVVYQILRLCFLIPIFFLNMILGNLCSSKSESIEQFGKNPNFNLKCHTRESLYFAFCLMFWCFHAYFIRTTYHLMVRFQYPALLDKKRSTYDGSARGTLPLKGSRV